MEDNLTIQEQKIYSFGDILVGLNQEEHTESTDVIEIKKAISSIIEKIKTNYDTVKSPAKSLIFDQAIGQLLSAQLISEKFLNM
jgi:hypothetical protein